MRFSVVIPTYGRVDKLINAVQSVLCQVYQDFEIIVVDDNGLGTNDQKKTSKEISRIKTDKIRYVVQKTNGGACSARNVGIQLSKGEFIAFLDDDDQWSLEFLFEINKEIENNCGLNIIYTDFYRLDENGLFYNPKEEKYEGYVFRNLIEGWCPASTSLFCIRKDCFDNCGLFNEKLDNLEEYDLWIRMARVYKFYHLPKRLIIKDESSHNQLTKNYLSRFHSFETLLKDYEGMLDRDSYQVLRKNFEVEMKKSYTKYIIDLYKNRTFSNFKQIVLDKKINYKSMIKVLLFLIIGDKLISIIKKQYVRVRNYEYRLNEHEEKEIRASF